MPSRIVTTLPYTELPVAEGNFDRTRKPITSIIIHTMVSSWQSAAAHFNDPKSEVSAHYGVKLDGGIIHWLEETFTAYQAGNYPTNQSSIGIEHEDNGLPNTVRPEIMYKTSGKLVADICKFYSIPCDRAHIKKHLQVSDKPTACPDSLDINRIIAEANSILNPAPDPTIALKKRIAELETQVAALQLKISKAKADLQ